MCSNFFLHIIYVTAYHYIYLYHHRILYLNRMLSSSCQKFLLLRLQCIANDEWPLIILPSCGRRLIWDIYLFYTQELGGLDKHLSFLASRLVAGQVLGVKVQDVTQVGRSTIPPLKSSTVTASLFELSCINTWHSLVGTTWHRDLAVCTNSRYCITEQLDVGISPIEYTNVVKFCPPRPIEMACHTDRQSWLKLLN